MRITTGESCVLKPVIDGKPSKLYEAIINRTGTQNRNIANFFYALSRTEKMKANFTKEDYNSQGELSPEKYLTRVKFSELISAQKELLNVRRSAGSVDKSGKPILYDSPDEIYNKVIDFNNHYHDYKATIKFVNGKFGIDVNMLGAGNFDINNYLQTKRASFDALNNFLEKNGLSVNYDDKLKSYTANFMNVDSYVHSLHNIIQECGKRRSLSPFQFSIVNSLLQDNSLYKRIKNRFGDSTDAVLSMVSGRKLVEIDDESTQKLDSYWTDRINDYLAALQDKMSHLNYMKMREEIDSAKSSVDTSGSDYGVSYKDIHDSINDLYKTFHLNKKINSTMAEDVQSLSEAAKVLQNKIAKEVELQRARGQNVNPKVLKNLTRLINQGRYSQGITSTLEYLSNKINYLQKLSDSLDKEFEKSPDTLEAINRLSSSVLQMIDLTNSYKDIVSKLSHADTLDVDEADLPQDIIDNIKQSARSVQNSISEVSDFARGKQFDCVYYFLKRYWGDSDVKYFEGKAYSLAGMLKVAENDVGFFDRFVYSMNETSDPVLGLVYEAVKDRNRARDAKLRKIQYITRVLNADLFKSSDSSFMYERDEKGNLTLNLVNNTDWDKFNDDKKKYKQYLIDEEGKTEKQAQKETNEWANSKLVKTSPFQNTIYKNAIAEYCKEIYGENENPDDYDIQVNIPNPKEYFKDGTKDMTPAQKEYYYKMMALKAVLQGAIPNIENTFFLAPQITSSVMDKLESGNPGDIIKSIKDNFLDNFRHSAEDYGNEFDEMLAGNDVRKAVSDMQGNELQVLPIFYNHKLKDASRLSTDFSRGIMATAAATVQYDEMNNVLDSMMLSKDWLMNRRKTKKVENGQNMMDIFKWGRQMFLNSIYREGGSSLSNGLLADFYEKSVFGKNRKPQSVSLFGCNISLDKAADFLTSYTSVTGLATNFLGAEDNVLVGKIQMLIEAGAGEFFGFKDLATADVQYFQMLTQYMNDIGTNNKSSLLGLLIDRFNALEDYSEKLKESGFHKTMLGKILGKGDMLFLYDIGEHMLHSVPMLAVLRHIKVYDTQTHTTVPMLSIFSVDKDKTGNGQLKEDFSRYQAIDKDDQGNEIHRKLTEEDVTNAEKRFTYVSKTMNGAFNPIDKGMAHRYAIGRLIMNFRQWMPALYGVRLRGVHYDVDEGEFRRGFYTSAYTFLGNCIHDMIKGKFNIATQLSELSDVDQYNLKRTIAEVGIFALLTVSNLSFGKYKDKKGNWAYRHAIYMTQRLLMETQADAPVIMPFSGYGAMGFVKNLITIMNSPIAAINTMENIAGILDFTNLACTVGSGKDEGQNLYLHNLKKELPFYGSITKQAGLGNEDYLFNVFKQNLNGTGH